MNKRQSEGKEWGESTRPTAICPSSNKPVCLLEAEKRTTMIIMNGWSRMDPNGHGEKQVTAAPGAGGLVSESFG